MTKCNRWFFSGHFALKSEQDAQDALWESLEIWVLFRIPFWRVLRLRSQLSFLNCKFRSQVVAAAARFLVAAQGSASA